MQAYHLKAHNTFTNFYLKDLTWSDNDNNMYLGPVAAAQALDPSPQHPHLREEKKGGGGGGGGGGGHTRCSQVLVTSPDVLGKVSYILNCIMY